MGPLERAFGRVRRSPLAWALAASLVLHLALAWYLGTRPPPPEPKRPDASGEVVFELVESPPTPAPAREEPRPTAPEKRDAHKAPAPGTPARKATAPPQSAAPSAERAEAPAPQEPAASPREQSHSPAGAPAAVADAPTAGPKLKSLLPGDEVVGGVPVPGSLLTGRTIRNDGSVPDAGSGEDLGEAVQKQVTQLTQDLLASRRVESGAVDSYFHDLRKALEQNVEFQLPMALDVKKGLKAAVESYRESLNAYGRAGNPGAVVGDNDLDTLGEKGDPNGTAAARAQLMEQTARVKKLLEDAYGTDPVVIVEIRQTHDGKFVGARVLQTSGNKVFDEKVLELVPTGIASALAVPDHVQAQHPVEIRSVWQFRGHYLLHKKLKDMKVENPADVAYLAAMGAASLLSGMPFDETKGDVYVLDAAHPRFHITPRLLQLY